MSVVVDYENQAVKLLASQFGDAEQFQKFLKILIAPFQEIEYELQRLMYLRSITLADGAQLDKIGGDLEQPRGGLTDANYRDALRLRIRRNVHNASPNQIIEYARIVSSATIIEFIEGLASYTLNHNGDVTKLTQAVLEDVTAAGVGVELNFITP